MGHKNKKKKILHEIKECLELCDSYNVEVHVNEKSITEHYSSEKHIRKNQLFILYDYFLKYSLDWAPTGNSYWCSTCKKQLPVNSEVLITYIQKYHIEEYSEILDSLNIVLPTHSKVLEVDRVKVWMCDFPSTRVALNEYLLSFNEITSPVGLIENGPKRELLGDLRNSVFSHSELSVITKVTSYLEKKGSYVQRSHKKGGSTICAFDMRSAYGDTGWYNHRNKDCYKLSEELASFISIRLSNSFPSVFKHLEAIRVREGVGSTEGNIGKSPFTCFSITRDYGCKPHLDQDDYDWGFIIWIQKELVEDEDHPGFFAMPDMKCFFYPRHGDVLCFKPKSIHHCTRRLANKNQLGLAFFQKCSLFRQLGKIIRSRESQENIDFQMKQKKYEEECSSGHMTISMF